MHAQLGGYVLLRDIRVNCEYASLPGLPFKGVSYFKGGGSRRFRFFDMQIRLIDSTLGSINRICSKGNKYRYEKYNLFIIRLLCLEMGEEEIDLQLGARGRSVSLSLFFFFIIKINVYIIVDGTFGECFFYFSPFPLLFAFSLSFEKN